MRLERIGFATLTRDVLDGSLTAAVEIIRDHYDHPALDVHVLDALDTLKSPLLGYLSGCMGIDPDDKPDPKAKGKGETVTFAEHLRQLYRVGTGWLGWTPADSLDSTPAEIIEAHKGRIEMLKAIFGGGDDKSSKPTQEQLATKFNFILRARTASPSKEV